MARCFIRKLTVAHACFFVPMVHLLSVYCPLHICWGCCSVEDGQPPETPSPVVTSQPAEPTPCEDPAGSYEQCGGTDWTGTECCAYGWECTEMVPCYSQVCACVLSLEIRLFEEPRMSRFLRVPPTRDPSLDLYFSGLRSYRRQGFRAKSA